MKHWWYDHVRSLCDLKSKLRNFEQFAATDFARTIAHDRGMWENVNEFPKTKAPVTPDRTIL